jgi:prepilin-type N-terminal cleavage/methylation domain-containing protein/prepilin-type processing-associated H-X9-DG protein
MRLTRYTSSKGFTLLELIIVLCIVGVLMAMLFPTNPRRKEKSRLAKCMTNLKQQGVGFAMFAEEHKGNLPFDVAAAEGGSLEFKENGSAAYAHFRAMSNYFGGGGHVFICPTDKRTVLTNGLSQLSNEHLSYFISPDATLKETAPLPLSGDRNLDNGRARLNGFIDLKLGSNLRWNEGLHMQTKVWGGGSILFTDGHVEELGAPDQIRTQALSNRVSYRIAVP